MLVPAGSGTALSVSVTQVVQFPVTAPVMVRERTPFTYRFRGRAVVPPLAKRIWRS